MPWAFELRRGASGSAAPQGHGEEEEEERGWGRIAGGPGRGGRAGREGGRASPRSVDAEPWRGSSPACGASLHPSSANKASAAPVPPLPLTHQLTQPNPRTAPHFHFLTYKARLITTTLLLLYITAPRSKPNPAALGHSQWMPEG